MPRAGFAMAAGHFVRQSLTQDNGDSALVAAACPGAWRHWCTTRPQEVLLSHALPAGLTWNHRYVLLPPDCIFKTCWIAPASLYWPDGPQECLLLYHSTANVNLVVLFLQEPTVSFLWSCIHPFADELIVLVRLACRCEG